MTLHFSGQKIFFGGKRKVKMISQKKALEISSVFFEEDMLQ